MVQRRKPRVISESSHQQDIRDQEVLRANRELAAYFKGRRTEREARAALKIIKAFVRDRERRDARNRPPLPGRAVAKTPKEATNRKAARAPGERHQRKRPGRRRTPREKPASSIEPQVPLEPSDVSNLDERTGE